MYDEETYAAPDARPRVPALQPGVVNAEDMDARGATCPIQIAIIFPDQLEVGVEYPIRVQWNLGRFYDDGSIWYEWYMDGQFYANTRSKEGKITFSLAGTHDLRIIVYCPAMVGICTPYADKHFTVGVANAPVLHIGASSENIVEGEKTFLGVWWDSGEHNVTPRDYYYFDFGDGEHTYLWPSQLEKWTTQWWEAWGVAHVFKKPGVYTVGVQMYFHSLGIKAYDFVTVNVASSLSTESPQIEIVVTPKTAAIGQKVDASIRWLSGARFAPGLVHLSMPCHAISTSGEVAIAMRGCSNTASTPKQHSSLTTALAYTESERRSGWLAETLLR